MTRVNLLQDIHESETIPVSSSRASYNLIYGVVLAFAIWGVLYFIQIGMLRDTRMEVESRITSVQSTVLEYQSLTENLKNLESKSAMVQSTQQSVSVEALLTRLSQLIPEGLIYESIDVTSVHRGANTSNVVDGNGQSVMHIQIQGQSVADPMIAQLLSVLSNESVFCKVHLKNSENRSTKSGFTRSFKIVFDVYAFEHVSAEGDM